MKFLKTIPLPIQDFEREKPLAEKNFHTLINSYSTKNSKTKLLQGNNNKVRYLNNDTMALNEISKMILLYESIEADLIEKGINSSLLENITPREQTIIMLIAEGLQTKEIAKTLFISDHTVQKHRKNIYKKLNITSISDLVKISLLLNVI